VTGPEPPRILTMWSVPRSRSTAFYRMMAERGDFATVHEPFSYLANNGQTEVDGEVVSDEASLLAAIRTLAGRRPVFTKDTTDERYPGLLADREFLRSDARHTFLIRHPRDTIASYHAINPRMRRHNLGFESLYEIYQRVAGLTGRPPVVMDGDDLVADPHRMVRAYCAAVGIPYLPQALAWRPGDRPDWQPSARWHEQAAASSGFTRTGARHRLDVESDSTLRGYLDHHLPYYQALHAARLVPPPPGTNP
jgi:Sulfotransferase domain